MAESSIDGIRREGDTLRVRGAMTYATARKLEAAGAATLKGGEVVVDLSAAEALDSSALAMLFSWQRVQKRHGGALVVRGAPASLLTLARVYGASEQLVWR